MAVCAERRTRRSLGPFAVQTLLWRSLRPVERTMWPPWTSTISPPPLLIPNLVDVVVWRWFSPIFLAYSMQVEVGGEGGAEAEAENKK